VGHFYVQGVAPEKVNLWSVNFGEKGAKCRTDFRTGFDLMQIMIPNIAFFAMITNFILAFFLDIFWFFWPILPVQLQCQISVGTKK
jgi:hypothetical protein